MLLSELVNAQQRFPALFADTGEARALFALDGAIVRTNEVAFALLGCDPDDVLGSATAALGPACTDPSIRRAFGRAASGVVALAETTIVPRNGRPAIEFAITFAPAAVADDVVGVYASARDVTRERARERAAAREIAELSSLFERHKDAMIAIDTMGLMRSINVAFGRLTEHRLEDLVGRPYSTLIPSDVASNMKETYAHAMGGETIVGSTVLLHRDGSRIDVEGMVVPIVVAGEVVGVYAIGRDVREQRRLERDAREQSERMRELYLVAASTGQTAEAQLHAALELGCRRLQCSGAYLTRVEDGAATFVACTGDVPYAEGTRMALADLPSCSAAVALAPLGSASAHVDPTAFICAPIDVGGMRFGTVCFLAGDRLEATYSDADSDFVRLIGALAASTIERGEQRRKLDELAFFDPLTGLPNRRLLDDRLAQAIVKAQRDHSTFALHFYDLDGFKMINDEHGHLRGDEVLRVIGHRFARVTRDVDTVARIGGDEFIVVQPDVEGPQDATVLAERLRVAVAEPIELHGCIYRVSASAGIALYGDDGVDAHTLLGRADAALYRVKASGRDAIAFFSSHEGDR